MPKSKTARNTKKDKKGQKGKNAKNAKSAKVAEIVKRAENAEIAKIAEIPEIAATEIVRFLEKFKILVFFGKIDGFFEKKLEFFPKSLNVATLL